MNDAIKSIEETRPRCFHRYSAYKDSGIEWLGEVPEHWVTWKATHGFRRIGSGTTPKSDNPEYYDGDISWVTTSELRETVIVDTTKKVTTTAMREYPTLRMYPKGTLLFAMYGATIGRLGILGIAATVNQACAALAEPLHLATWFVYYWLQMRRPILIVLSAGGGQPNLSQDDLRQLRIPAPPLDEQRVIAAFLDRETAKIDGLVERKERLIELLQEKRATVITRAVTRGLDPSVPMKDSDVEWLGEIPAHWEVKRTKFAAMLRSGHTPSRQNPEYWKDCTIPWFGLADVWQIRDGQVEYVNATSEKISEIGLAHSAARLLPKGTVILSRTASVGFSAILGVAMATTQDFVNWVCGTSLQPEYLLYVFRAMGPEFRRFTMGSTHQTIYMPDVGCFSTPVPPVPEQGKIVAFIRKETDKIDSLVSKIRQAINHLKEFRTALISAAVTGRIDVRSASAETAAEPGGTS